MVGVFKRSRILHIPYLVVTALVFLICSLYFVLFPVLLLLVGVNETDKKRYWQSWVISVAYMVFTGYACFVVKSHYQKLYDEENQDTSELPRPEPEQTPQSGTA